MLLRLFSKIFIMEIESGILNKEIKRKKKWENFGDLVLFVEYFHFKKNTRGFCRDDQHLFHPFINYHFSTKLQNAEK